MLQVSQRLFIISNLHSEQIDGSAQCILFEKEPCTDVEFASNECMRLQPAIPNSRFFRTFEELGQAVL